MRSFLCVAAMAALALALPRTASAQPNDFARRDQVNRDGFIIGFSVGGGHLSADCEGCGDSLGAFAADLHLGGMINPRLAITGDVWVLGHSEEIEGLDGDLIVTQAIVTANARYWIAPIFWAQAGIGAAQLGYRFDSSTVNVEDESDTAPAITLGAGIEAIQSDTFTLDIQLRFGAGFYTEDDGVNQDTTVRNLSLSAGFNWY
ncbi:MAG TPA: outer membrane beta-barrel protein [Kofleriaceae bacterium]|nr:outer membrane beta-barrel protein [Kofleriaceae bacterium]